MTRRTPLAVLVLLVLAGCAGNVPDDPLLDSDGDGVPDEEEIRMGRDPHVAEAETGLARSVVAVIDSAVNPYHDFYHKGPPIPKEILATFVDSQGRPPLEIRLTMEGSWQERRDADADVWDNIEAGRLVHFVGTRLLAVSFGGNIISGGAHGTGTTSSVLITDPEAIVVLVQGVGGNEGEKWAATTPWVDILSESYGLYCGQPVVELATPESTARNNLVAWENGKIVVGAADNTPCPAMNDGTSGPPWVVGVSGDHPATEGACREPVSGNFPDFTADFTQDLPYGNVLNGTETVSGTSFATPTAAGAFSRALRQVREAWGHEGGIVDGALALSPEGTRLTHSALRDAFNHTATYFPLAPVCGQPGSVPVNPAAPWLQMGWGHLDDVVADHAAQVVLGTVEATPKPPAAVTYMQTIYTYRQAAWGAVI